MNKNKKLLLLFIAACLLRVVEVGAFNIEYGKVFYRLGLRAEKGRNINDAVKLFKRALETDPALPEAYYSLGKIYFDKKLYPQAIECFQKASYLEPNFDQAFNLLGLTLMEKGYYRRANDAFRRAINISPGYYQYWFNSGKAKLEMGNKQGTKNEFVALRAYGAPELADKLENLYKEKFGVE